MTTQINPQQNVRAVSRALSILTSFAGAEIQTLADVACATGLDKGTTRRLLLTLMDSGFVTQDRTTQHYRLGRAIHDLASSVDASKDLRAIARPHLMTLASTLSVTAFLSVFRDGAAICLERLHDMRGIEVHWWPVGGTMPLNVGAAPKLLLAYQQPDMIAERLATSSRRMSEKSVMDVATLTQQLAVIRNRGWELAVDDVAVGLSALAVAVLVDDRPLCAVSIAGLTPQLVDDKGPVHLEHLREVAAQIRQEWVS